MSSNRSWNSSEENPYASPLVDSTPAPEGLPVDTAAHLRGTRIGLQLVYLLRHYPRLACNSVFDIRGDGSHSVGRSEQSATSGTSRCNSRDWLGWSRVFGWLHLDVCRTMLLSDSPGGEQGEGFRRHIRMCPVISVLGSCGFITASFHANAADPELLISVMQFTNGVLGTVGFFCFLVFIKRVAQFINRGDMTQNAGNAIGIFVALFVLFYVMVIILIGLFLRRSRCARPQSLFS